MRLTLRGWVLVITLAVLAGVFAPLWNGYTAALDERAKSPGVTQQGAVPGDPTRPE